MFNKRDSVVLYNDVCCDCTVVLAEWALSSKTYLRYMS
jgi:hypothetical protein